MALKVLFIGGTGVISTACSREALAQGIDLYHLNRGKSAQSVPGVKQIVADIRDPGSVRAKLDGLSFDAVVDWIAFTPEHVRTDYELFRERTRQYIFISSASVYSKPVNKLPISEDMPIGHPYWKYAQDKTDCEKALLRYHKESGFPVTIVRPSHTYGPGMMPVPGGYSVIDRMRRGKKIVVHGDGTSIWVLTHNSDFARGFVGLLGNARAIGEAFHITSDELLNWNQIYTLLGEAAGVEPPIVHLPSEIIAAFDPKTGGGLLGDKAHSVIFDNSKIKSLVPKFTCTTSFKTAARDAVAWFDASPERRVLDKEFDGAMDRMVTAWEKWMASAKGRND